MKLLNHVCDRLQNAPHNASLHVVKRFKYFYVNNLIEYYQMEVRWSLRRLLIEAFLLMCYLDANIISIMLNSVLPLELVQDIYQTKVSYIYYVLFTKKDAFVEIRTFRWWLLEIYWSSKEIAFISTFYNLVTVPLKVIRFCYIRGQSTYVRTLIKDLWSIK